MAQTSNSDQNSIQTVKVSETKHYETRYNPWVITCNRWQQLGQYIVLPINPSDLAWHIPLNVASEQTKHTTVSYIWRNSYINISNTKDPDSEDSMLQDFELTISFNSANIAPMVKASVASDMKKSRTSVADYTADPDKKASDLINFADYGAMDNPVAKDKTSVKDPDNYITDYDDTVPLGVQNLYRFLSLIDEEKVFVRTKTSTTENLGAQNVRANRIILVANTPAFPHLLVYGHIMPSGVSWEESAEHPNSFDVSFTMTVTETYPHLGLRNFASALTSYKSALSPSFGTREQLEAAELEAQTNVASSTKQAAGTLSATQGSATPSETAGDGATGTPVAQTEADKATADASSATGTEDAATTTSEPDLTKYDTTSMTAAELDDLKNTIATGETPTTEAAQTAIEEANISALSTASASDFQASSLTADTKYSAKQKAAIKALTTSQLLNYAAQATVGGTAYQNQAALTVAENSNLTNEQKVNFITNTKNSIAASKATRTAASTIPGATRKGSKSS